MVSGDDLVSDILKVHVSQHGLDLIKMTSLHDFIYDTGPLGPECTCPALSSTPNICLQLHLL